MKAHNSVDAYIAQAPPYARPILLHIRALVHEACPTVDETIKWGQPFFTYQGRILCFMAAFKKHCAFGFWAPEIRKLIRETDMPMNSSRGSVGRICKLEDLPRDDVMIGFVRQAVAISDADLQTVARAPKKKTRKPAVPIPEDFAAALGKTKAASTAFSTLSLSHRREYLEWIGNAKRAETRTSRIATSIEWLRQGKSRHWKYATR